jgi:hypothetical protein
MQLTAHCLVCNEDRWIWYSLNSVLDYVDKLMVWDTGSKDFTQSAVKLLSNHPKLNFKRVRTTPSETALSHVRTQSLSNFQEQQ